MNIDKVLYDTSFKSRLDYLMKEKNITDHELANYINVSRLSIKNWRNRKTYPNIKYLKALCKFFNVSINWLTRGS